MKVILSKKAEKFIKKQEKKQRDRITCAIKKYATENIGDIKKIQGQKNCYRLRVGDYRVIFDLSVDGQIKIMYINDIDNRGDIY